MDKGQKIFWGIMAVAVIGVSAFVGSIIWANTVTWTDTGNISWVGQKTFDGQWHTPFAITTLHHGTLNFTYPDVTMTYSSQPIPPDRSIMPLPIGVVRYNAGTYRLVVDP